MSITTTVKWFERTGIVLSALALLITFISLPNTPPSAWGWFVLAVIVFALGGVVLAYFVHQRSDRTREGNLFLLLAWKVAGYYGLDRVVLPHASAWTGYQISRIGRRCTARGTESIAKATIQVSATAMSLGEMHGFE